MLFPPGIKYRHFLWRWRLTVDPCLVRSQELKRFATDVAFVNSGLKHFLDFAFEDLFASPHMDRSILTVFSTLLAVEATSNMLSEVPNDGVFAGSTSRAS